MANLDGYLCWCLLVSVLAVRVKASPGPQVDVGDPMEMDERDARSTDSNVKHEESLVRSDLDLRLTLKQYRLFHRKQAHDPIGGQVAEEETKSGVKLWPEATMYYAINADDFTKKQIYLIKTAFTEIERYTCVKFRPNTAANKNYVDYVHGNSGCSSDLGLLDKGRQDIHLNAFFCRRRGKYIHETLHSLGVIHQHQRWDRDKYVTVNWDNVEDGAESQFNKYPKGSYPHIDSPYSFRSIMHYSKNALSDDPDLPTLTPKDTTQGADKYMGQRTGLSYIDVLWLNKMYKCAENCSETDKTKCGQNGHLDQSCNCICDDGTQDCDTTKVVKEYNALCNNTHDYEWQCYRWAANGACLIKDEWMKANCAKACGECGRDTVTGGSGSSKSCYDRYHDCQPSVNAGHCNIGDPWTKSQCAKSCGFCREGECHDYYQQCQSAVITFGCTHPWMKNNCSKTCGTCTYACEDKHKECTSFKDRGVCVTSPLWMQDNCPKACNYCHGRHAPRPEINCSDKERKEDKCFKWAINGHCTIRPDYMAKHCPKTCQVCNRVAQDIGHNN